MFSGLYLPMKLHKEIGGVCAGSCSICQMARGHWQEKFVHEIIRQGAWKFMLPATTARQRPVSACSQETLARGSHDCQAYKITAAHFPIMAYVVQHVSQCEGTQQRRPARRSLDLGGMMSARAAYRMPTPMMFYAKSAVKPWQRFLCFAERHGWLAGTC